MKRVLLPVDFSNNSWNAVFTASKLYREEQCTFLLLNSYEPKFANILGAKSKERIGVILDSLAINSRLQLEKMLAYFKTNNLNEKHCFETKSTANNLVKAITEALKERTYDLVVMGTKGATGAKEVYMGSKTVKVIKKVDTCSILAVPETYDLKSLDTLVFPTDFKHEFKIAQFVLLKELVNVWKTKINILQIVGRNTLSGIQKLNKIWLNKSLDDVEHEFVEEPIWNNVADGIISWVENNKVDLIVLIHYRHTFFEQLTREPVIKKIGFHTKLPLLILN